MTTGVPDAPGGRRRLILLALLFTVPPLVAAFLYFSGWHSATTVNRGELISPPRPLDDVELTVLDGSPRRLSSLNGRWSLYYLGPAACGPACERILYNMRQVVASLGEDADRVQRVFVATDLAGRDLLRVMLKNDPGMIVLAGPPERISVLVAQFAPAQAAPAGPSGRIYLVDPLGNLMMQYGPDKGPMDMRKDLVRLLRISRVG